uniref:Uncharacterized protein n=1 Tax=virus sp. ctah610 TaxID=2826807 RepID=A0A8S5R6Q4_9VIRU|nr:MAG TPA: hypothetical protein [virus sp. ctah610]
MNAYILISLLPCVYPVIKPLVLLEAQYYTSGDFPELTAYYSLSPVALISGKVFYRI